MRASADSGLWDDSGAGSDGRFWSSGGSRGESTPRNVSIEDSAGDRHASEPVRKSGPMHQQFRSPPASMGSFSRNARSCSGADRRDPDCR